MDAGGVRRRRRGFFGGGVRGGEPPDAGVVREVLVGVVGVLGRGRGESGRGCGASDPEAVSDPEVVPG